MRYKPVPTPASVDALDAVQAAVPLVPGSTSDCCARIVGRTHVERRDDARAWLTFLTALGLIAETGSGFVRTDRDPTDPGVATVFEDHVYGAREVLAALADAETPVDAATVTESVSVVPRWERHRSPTADTDWQNRVQALLDWAVVFDLASNTSDGYTASSRGDA